MSPFAIMIKTGVWSDDNSRQEVHSVKFSGMPFVIQKSNRSGIFYLSDGQYVGWPEEITFSPKV